MKHLKKLMWLPDALSDGSIVTSDGPFTIPPEQAIQFADYRFNKQQNMMSYNTVIALDRGEDCSDRNDGNTSFTKTFLSKIGTAPVLIRSELLPPNTTTGDTEFDKTYPFWCLAVTIVSSEIDLTNTYLCLEACNTGHNHQSHTWGYDNRQFYGFPLEAKKYLSGGIVKYKAIPDAKSFSFITTKIAEARSNIKLSVEGITQIKNPKVGKTYYLYIALPYNYLRYKQYLYDKLHIEDEDWNTYIKFRPCIKYKRENIRDLNMYTLPLSSPYELNCRYPEIFYSAWSTNTTTLPPPSIETAVNRIDADYLGTTSQFSYSIGWPIENGTVSVTKTASWITINSHSLENKTVSFTISENTTTGNRSGYIDLTYSTASTRIYVYQSGKPSISIDKTSADFASIGGEATVTCQTSNGSGDITVSSTRSWITTSVSGNIVTISVSENTSTSSRDGSVTISYSNITQSISIGQYGKPVVTLGSTSASFSSSGGTKTISCTISGYGNVTVSKDVLWLSASYNSSSSSIVITANENNSTLSNREATITVRCGNSDIKTITVTQAKKVVSYSYTVSYTVSNTTGASLSFITINLCDASTGMAMGLSQSSLSGTITFSSTKSSLSVYLSASGRTSSNKIASGKSSNKLIYPGTTASLSCNLYLENSGGDSGEITLPGQRPTVTVDPGVLGPRSVPDPSTGDSNSLEDILDDYETDQI